MREGGTDGERRAEQQMGGMEWRGESGSACCGGTCGSMADSSRQRAPWRPPLRKHYSLSPGFANPADMKHAGVPFIFSLSLIPFCSRISQRFERFCFFSVFFFLKHFASVLKCSRELQVVEIDIFNWSALKIQFFKT